MGDQQATLSPPPTQNLQQPATPAKPETDSGSKAVTASTIHRMLGFTSFNREDEERLKQEHAAQQQQVSNTIAMKCLSMGGPWICVAKHAALCYICMSAL